MKKTFFTLMMILTLTLSACGSTATEANTASIPTDYENALSLQLQLSTGILKLEGTDLAVDADQATESIPLWQVLNSLEESGSAAPEETDALLLQIQETLTAEQIDAIVAMQLSLEDVGSIMQEYGLSSGMGSGETPPEGFTPGSGRDSDVPGLSGGGSGSGENATGMTPEEIATAQAEREEGTMVNSKLASAITAGLIEVLQGK